MAGYKARCLREAGTRADYPGKVQALGKRHKGDVWAGTQETGRGLISTTGMGLKVSRKGSRDIFRL